MAEPRDAIVGNKKLTAYGKKLTAANDKILMVYNQKNSQFWLFFKENKTLSPLF
jgi:hypothetical protein